MSAPLEPAPAPSRGPHGVRGARALLLLPFRRHTWRHLLHALLFPLIAGPLLVLQPVMRGSQERGDRAVGPLLLLLVLAVAGAAGPAYERLRLRVFFGERLAPRDSGRLRGGVALFFTSMVLTTLAFAATVGWVIVSARNLTYPVWGWEPYPTDAWGGPTPVGAVALHFAAGVAAFFLLPWAVVRLTRWQRAAVHRFATSSATGPRTAGPAQRAGEDRRA
jgi:hypothetical protein